MAPTPLAVTKRRAESPDDGDVATVYRGAAAMIAVGGVVCILQAAGDTHLTLAEARRARSLGIALVAAGVGGAATNRTGAVVARLVRARPHVTVAAGLAATAANQFLGGARSPAHFATGAGVAIAGGLLDRQHARAYGAVAGAVWIAQSRLNQRYAPDRRQPDRMWAEFTYPLQMIGNATLGSVFGTGALGTRSLQHTLRRLDSQLRDLEGLRNRLEQARKPFLDAVDEFAAAGGAHRDADRGAIVREAAERSRDRFADVTAALEAAGDAATPRTTSIDVLVDEVIRHGTHRLELRKIGSSDGAALSPRAQLAAHLVILRALSNARRHGTLGPVSIELTRSEHRTLSIQIRSPARHTPDGKPRYGQGARDSEALLLSLGGTFQQFALDGNFVVEARLPIGETPRLSAHSGIATDLLALVERAAWDLLRLNGAMVLAMSWAGGQYVGSRRRSQLMSTALPVAAELVRVVKPEDRSRSVERLLAFTAIVEALSPHGEFAPAAGWGGMLLSTYALQDAPKRLPIHAGALAAAVISSYRGSAEGFPLMAGREGVGMVLPGVAALFLRRGFGRVEVRERRLAGLIEELEQLQGVAEEVAFRTHGFAEPVENALGLLEDDPTALRLQAAIRDLRTAGSDLSRALDDRNMLVEELVDALACRVWPAVVEVRTAFQNPVAIRSTGLMRRVAARRRVLESMALASDHLLETVKPGALGRWPLEAVELTVSEIDGGLMLVSLVPRPRVPMQHDRLEKLTEALAGLGGTMREGFDDGRLSFTILLDESRSNPEAGYGRGRDRDGQ